MPGNLYCTYIGQGQHQTCRGVTDSPIYVHVLVNRNPVITRHVHCPGVPDKYLYQSAKIQLTPDMCRCTRLISTVYQSAKIQSTPDMLRHARASLYQSAESGQHQTCPAYTTDFYARQHTSMQQLTCRWLPCTSSYQSAGLHAKPDMP